MRSLTFPKRNRKLPPYFFPVQRVVTAERNHPPIQSCIMDTTTRYPVEIDVIEILKVHDAQKECFAVELLYDIFRKMRWNLVVLLVDGRSLG